MSFIILIKQQECKMNIYIGLGSFVAILVLIWYVYKDDYIDFFKF